MGSAEPGEEQHGLGGGGRGDGLVGGGATGGDNGGGEQQHRSSLDNRRPALNKVCVVRVGLRTNHGDIIVCPGRVLKPQAAEFGVEEAEADVGGWG